MLDLFKKISRKLYYLIKRKQGRFLFVHIPKTAGTSFRMSLDLSHRTLITDYGDGSRNTEKLIQEYVYDKTDSFSLKKSLLKLPSFWITGHVAVSKYIDIVDACNIVLFVRDPLEQVLSHYNHYHLSHGYDGTFEDFLNSKLGSNFQSGFVDYLPPELIGFVGITEQYDKSLDICENISGLELKRFKKNVNTNKYITSQDLTESQISLFELRNKEDRLLYERTVRLHYQRLMHFSKNLKWTYYCISVDSLGNLSGCAYKSGCDVPVILSLIKDGETLCDVVADQYFKCYPKANFPRHRYIGFHFDLNGFSSSLEDVKVIVKDTGQELFL